MAANLTPGTEAFHQEADELIRAMLASAPDSAGNTPEGKRERKVTGMILEEPNTDPAVLEQVTAPTLILAGDHDLIRIEHLVDMFNHLQNAQLGIFPNSTHMVPFDDPQLFNTTVERFLSTPFEKRDRIADLMTSYQRLLSTLPK
jgi:pimeloyl-ACP methyl ester carboxylesterase